MVHIHFLKLFKNPWNMFDKVYYSLHFTLKLWKSIAVTINIFTNIHDWLARTVINLGFSICDLIIPAIRRRFKLECTHPYDGPKCDTCAFGYFGYPFCQSKFYHWLYSLFTIYWTYSCFIFHIPYSHYYKTHLYKILSLFCATCIQVFKDFLIFKP